MNECAVFSVYFFGLKFVDKVLTMSLYPTLEDMKVSQLQQAQYVPAPAYDTSSSAPPMPAYDVSAYTFSQQQPTGTSSAAALLYPTVDEYMGLSLQHFHAAHYQNAAQVLQRSIRAALSVWTTFHLSLFRTGPVSDRW